MAETKRVELGSRAPLGSRTSKQALSPPVVPSGVHGDQKLQGEGKLDQAKGKVQNAVGGIKDALKGKS